MALLCSEHVLKRDKMETTRESLKEQRIGSTIGTYDTGIYVSNLGVLLLPF